MYYGKINDTEIKDKGGITDPKIIVNSLKGHGHVVPHQQQKMGSWFSNGIMPDQIILGFSFKNPKTATNIANVLNENGIPYSSLGGISRWATSGGKIT